MEELTIKDIAKPAGGVVALSLSLGLSRGAVSQWEVVPIKRIKEVSRLTGYSFAQIRPDVFGDVSSSQEAA